MTSSSRCDCSPLRIFTSEGYIFMPILWTTSHFRLQWITRESPQIGGPIMTDSQKKQIVALREQKVTYVAISEGLGIPVSTIKTFCRRNGMTMESRSKKTRCKNCGAELTNTPKARPRLFCSDQCKQTWWNKHRWERVSTKIVPHTCSTCGKVFADYCGAHRNSGSHECYRERGGRDGQ